jgi:hypothetical protein
VLGIFVLFSTMCRRSMTCARTFFYAPLCTLVLGERCAHVPPPSKGALAGTFSISCPHLIQTAQNGRPPPVTLLRGVPSLVMVQHDPWTIVRSSNSSEVLPNGTVCRVVKRQVIETCPALGTAVHLVSLHCCCACCFVAIAK